MALVAIEIGHRLFLPPQQLPKVNTTLSSQQRITSTVQIHLPNLRSAITRGGAHLRSSVPGTTGVALIRPVLEPRPARQRNERSPLQSEIAALAIPQRLSLRRGHLEQKNYHRHCII